MANFLCLVLFSITTFFCLSVVVAVSNFSHHLLAYSSTYDCDFPLLFVHTLCTFNSLCFSGSLPTFQRCLQIQDKNVRNNNSVHLLKGNVSYF